MDEFNPNNIISTKSDTFRFNSVNSSSADYWCDITINVKYVKYVKYGVGGYAPLFSNKNLETGDIDDSHPFYVNYILKDHIEGAL